MELLHRFQSTIKVNSFSLRLQCWEVLVATVLPQRRPVTLDGIHFIVKIWNMKMLNKENCETLILVQKNNFLKQVLVYGGTLEV